MPAVTPTDIKKLREKTGAGMMDCKKALTENEGNIQQSIDWLRKNGLLKAEKKLNRIAAQGLVAVAIDGKKSAVIEVNSETDFVARNQIFQKFVHKIAQIAIEKKADINDIINAQYDEKNSVSEKIKEIIAVLGENIVLRKAKFIETKNGVIAHYIHGAIGENQLGKIGVLCSINAEQKDKLKQTGKNLAMHIAAARPLVIHHQQLSEAIIQREKNIYREKEQKSGKPQNIIDKIIEGQMKKFYQQVALMTQVHLVDGKKTVAQLLEQSDNAEIEDFARIELGEELQKKTAS